MHMLYDSDSYAVVQIDVLPELGASKSAHGDRHLTRGGFEIVDKLLRKEIYIEGAMAETFREGVDALIDGAECSEAFDAYLEQYASMAIQPVTMH